MRVLVYSETPAAKLRVAELRAMNHSVLLCNPEFFAPADLRGIDEVAFPAGHRLFETVRREAEQRKVACVAIDVPEPVKPEGKSGKGEK